MNAENLKSEELKKKFRTLQTKKNEAGVKDQQSTNANSTQISFFSRLNQGKNLHML